MSLLQFWLGIALIGAFIICLSTILSFVFRGSPDEKDAHIACLIGLGLILAPLTIPLLLFIGTIRSLFFAYNSLIKQFGEMK